MGTIHRPLLSSIAAVFLITSAVPAARAVAYRSAFVTRGDAAMILLQARLPSIPPVPGGGKYPDVTAGSPEERYLVLAARYGILEVENGTNRLYPHIPINRAAFVKMLARTFNLQTETPSRYRDVQPKMWFAPYAGIAERHHLFADKDPTLFKPGNLMTASEVARAVQIIAYVREQNARPIEVTVTKDARNPASDVISTRQEAVTMVMTPGQAALQPQVAPAAPPAPSPRIAPLYSRAELRDQILTLVNRERAARRLGTLRLNPALESSAQRYAETMAAKGFFGHTGPNGETFRDRIGASGYVQPTAQDDCLCVRRFVLGENLARGQLTASEVVQDWLNSPAHRAALLSPRFSDTGIGITAGFWVAHFGGVERAELQAKR